VVGVVYSGRRRGVQNLFGADYPHGGAGQDEQFYQRTLKAMDELIIPKGDKIYCPIPRRLLNISTRRRFNSFESFRSF
jgi:hypothetical protein